MSNETWLVIITGLPVALIGLRKLWVIGREIEEALRVSQNSRGRLNRIERRLTKVEKKLNGDQ